MKRQETIAIEKALQKSLFGSNPKLAKYYGTTEVTIGFQRNGNGKEIVDFLSYDPKEDVFRCYEIKATMADFKSKAKKSWYGNYNYLVLSENLYKQRPLKEWVEDVPSNVGIVVVNTSSLSMKYVAKSSKVEIANSTKEALKNSLIRTLFYQNQKDDWYLRGQE